MDPKYLHGTVRPDFIPHVVEEVGFRGVSEREVCGDLRGGQEGPDFPFPSQSGHLLVVVQLFHDDIVIHIFVDFQGQS